MDKLDLGVFKFRDMPTEEIKKLYPWYEPLEEPKFKPDDPWRWDWSNIELEDGPDTMIVPRDAYCAEEPEHEEPLALPVSNIFVIYTGTVGNDACTNALDCTNTVERLQTYWMEVRKEDDIPYNFVLGQHGVIWEGRGWNNQPSLPKKYAHFNDRCLYVGLIGNKIQGATKELLEGFEELIQYGVYHKYITTNILQYNINKPI